MRYLQHPFQCLRYVARESAGQSDLLIAAAGAKIYSYSASTGDCLDVFPSANESTPPGKRRKLSSPSEQKDEQSESAGKQSKEDVKLTWSSIPLLIVAQGKYVIFLTAEDKCIRVYSLKDNGQFVKESVRTMPKRPSVLALTPNENDILCADKFGDVYIIPVIPSSEYKRVVAEEKEYAPSATNLTVHTKRNLESLEQQMRQAALKKKASAEATALNFEHQAIIGHVSMLTDMVSVTRPADSITSHPRNYILTADRDEHIRVSRGHPQAHVIEQYCFGHTSFISKLCIPSWAPNVLISGGGDKHLLVWNWVEGQVLQKVSLPESETDITVSGIWAVSDNADCLKSIFVAFEGSSQLLCYTLENDNTLKQQETLQLSGNVIDLVSIGSKDTIAVSVDNLREPNSTSVWRSSPQALLETFRVEVGKWVPAEDSIVSSINTDSSTLVHTELDEKTTKSLNEQLYGLSVLRKNGWN
ncbi:uncharacterized protein N7446_003295 [Penicillium canescens]|uniref:Transfer RNA methyltransferase 82 n=1 Tax=Penicillium canescens TaxID=5083 RepID=A0AAD6IGU8_PENCN|nr:uncharacterized protein N7446_003295 [Penicillium canescens]KAJ6045093.1 hypothetical protein N7460_006448 [Penicillium canescens]KAJ6056563.1 hypothetical protein N7444_005661 [Penicillium canescens]KAJ6075518.1 hypothetical protein N7446_003295 [Penicillium canescens]